MSYIAIDNSQENASTYMSDIQLIDPFTNKPLTVVTDGLKNDHSFFPLKNGAYRVIREEENYTGNFGFQWNKFAATQIDKSKNLSLSYSRFMCATGWDKENLEGKNILEVGSGAGRFSQIVLDHTKANLYSVDYSSAVEANYKNNGPHERLNLFQASIYDLPFAPAQFDKVFCFGVLQHTPDVEKSVASLIAMAKPGAEVVVDFYPIRGWWTKIHSKYIFRPFTKNMHQEKLFSLIEKNADRLMKTYRIASKIGGKVLTRFVPVVDIDGTLPKNVSKEHLKEMVILDTFDMFSPQYDQPQRISTVKKMFQKYGMENVWGGMVDYDEFQVAIVKGIKSKTS